MALTVDRAKSRWRELPQRTRRIALIATEVVVALALLLWISSLGWGFAYVVAVIWILRIDDDRLRWGLEAALLVVTLVFLTPLGLITLLIVALAESPERIRRFALPIAAIAVLAAYPFYNTHLFTIPVFGAFPALDTVVFMIVFMMMAVGLNIVVGYAGLLDLGYVAFYAMGAYTAAWFSSQQFAGSRCPKAGVSVNDCPVQTVPVHSFDFGAIGV